MVKKMGMPSMRHHDFGNLYIQFEIEFPPVVPSLNSFRARESLKYVLGVETAQEQMKREQEEKEYQAFKASRRTVGGAETGRKLPNGMDMDMDLDHEDPLETDVLQRPIPSDPEIIIEQRADDTLDPDELRLIDPVRRSAVMEDEGDEDGAQQGGERMQCATQ